MAVHPKAKELEISHPTIGVIAKKFKRWHWTYIYPLSWPLPLEEDRLKQSLGNVVGKRFDVVDVEYTRDGVLVIKLKRSDGKKALIALVGDRARFFDEEVLFQAHGFVVRNYDPDPPRKKSAKRRTK